MTAYAKARFWCGHIAKQKFGLVRLASGNCPRCRQRNGDAKRGIYLAIKKMRKKTIQKTGKE